MLQLKSAFASLSCNNFMKQLPIILLFLLSLVVTRELYAQKSKQEIYEIRIYKLKDKTQEDRVDVFLKNTLVPAFHTYGTKNIGVFKPLETDSTSGKRIFVLIPYSSMEDFFSVNDLVATQGKSGNSEYIDASYTNPPYDRMESILLRAFPGMAHMEAPLFTNARSERIYELRSYESATEKIYRNKVQMFNQGDEIGLFKRLGFHAVFYADVIAGNRIPNLMYMTTFADRTSHDEHWKAFVDDPQWKKLSGMPEYQHNVSKINIFLLRPTDYSDY